MSHVGLSDLSPLARPSNTLVLMGCSQTKRPDPRPIPLIERYDGSTWQTLRAHMGPWQNSDLRVVVLSGQYGIIDARESTPAYEARLTPERAAHQIKLGLNGRQTHFGALQKGHHAGTAAQVLRPPRGRGDARAQPWAAVICCAGSLYRAVFASLIDDLRRAGDVTDDTQVLYTRGGIGEQRSQLGRWVGELAMRGARHQFHPTASDAGTAQPTACDAPPVSDGMDERSDFRERCR